MFGIKPRITPLEARKRLLVLESELNRLQFGREWEKLTDSYQALSQTVQTVRSVASMIGMVVKGVSAFGGRKSSKAERESSWIQKGMQGAQMASALWSAFRGR